MKPKTMRSPAKIMTMVKRPLILASLALAVAASADKPITITFLHSNDMHAHMEGATIQKKQYGGYARQMTLIERFRGKDPNVVLLNAGDTFQGTLYFNVYEGLADLAYMNAARYDAMCLGNHEFDRGPATLSNFVKRAQFPILATNLDFANEPALRDLVKPFSILTVGGQRLGVVGAITPDVFDISSPGPNIKLRDLRMSVQSSVDELTKMGVNKIVLLTHIGYEVDKELIAQLHDVDVVIGGHSHSQLGTPALPGWTNPEGPYPTMVRDQQGRAVPIVQCWEWSKVFGHLQVRFDGQGHIVTILDAKPVVVDESIPEDGRVASLIAALQKPIASLQNQEVGFTITGLARGNANPMGSVIADAMLAATAKSGAVAAFVNAGGVRSNLEGGKITYGSAISVQPFNNTLVLLDLTGTELKAAFEESVADAAKTGGLLYPSAATSYTVDFSKQPGNRISDIVVARQALDLAKTYRVALPSFSAGGGDAHVALKNSQGKRTNTGLLDIDALVDYLRVHNPITAPEGRVRRMGG